MEVVHRNIPGGKEIQRILGKGASKRLYLYLKPMKSGTYQ